VEPYERYTQDVLADTRGRTTGAFFDFDGTIIATHSITDMFLERLREGEVGVFEVIDLGEMVSRYLLDVGGFEDALAAAVENFAGVPAQHLAELGRKVGHEHLIAEIYPEVKAMIRAHQRQGHTVAIVSSATRYQVETVAKHLGIEHILCTEVEVLDGHLTGRLVGEPCFGEEKLCAVRRFARQRHISLAKSYCYSDGAEDLPLLEAVGHPTVINPDSRLAAAAKRAGWTDVRLDSRGTLGVGDVVRSLLVYGSALPLLAAGLPMRALGFSHRETSNVFLNLWTTLASAIARLKLIVDGEEHLWSHRPAVFVFNHQSAVDVLITARLLREDIVPVAKQEIRNQLPMGPAFSFTDAVFIDREHVNDPGRALAPAARALEEGRSVAIAPEGTRSQDGHLGRFKLGAFHLARDVGVPIVPIVIHNAQDALPYKAIFVRPAEVKVTVMPPIDTTGWTGNDLHAQADRLRARYLAVLGQADAPTPAMAV
jgi:putative phosphoserine phosphatase/1-acylglycerol-3-phosphate O-acyltransferase